MKFSLDYKIVKTACLFMFLLVGLLTIHGCARTSDLISNGKSDYKIFVSEKAIKPEKNAALELQKYLQKVSGCKLEITNEVKPDDKLVYIGFQEAPQSILKDLDTAAFGNEEFIIRSDGKNLLIAGGNTRGTMYGVNAYLADYLGCRWFTREVEKIPAQSTIKLVTIEDRQKPAFEYRQPYYHEANDTTWALHNRLNISGMSKDFGGGYVIFPFVHTFSQLVPPEKYFANHPEYFSEVDGKRAVSQLCLTNVNATRIAISTVFEWIKTHPEANVFSIDQNDFAGFCTCENCKELDEKEGSHSGTLLNFVNQIADTVAKVYPKVQLQTLAYDYTEIPPKTLRPANNVMIRLCHYAYCSAHALGKCNDHKQYIERLEQWKKISNRITIWDYYTQFNKYLMPYPNLETVKNDVKFYADRGVVGLFAQGNNVPDNGGGEFTELRAWVFAQLMWNPEKDGQQLVDEFVKNVYGDASVYISEYIKLLHDQVKSDSAYFSIWTDPEDVNYLNIKTIEKADSLFSLAKEVAKNDSALLKRVERAYLPVIFTKLYFYSIGGNAYIPDEKLTATLNDYKRIIADNHITRTAEGEEPGNISKFIERVELADNYIKEWWIIGPFDNEERKGFAAVYEPEKQFDTTKIYSGKNGLKVKWKKYKDETIGFVDFAKSFELKKNVVSYAYRVMNLAEPKTIKFGVGSNDGVRVWINGKLVLDRPVLRRAVPNEDVISVPMNKGENTILVKVDQLGNKWGFYFSERK